MEETTTPPAIVRALQHLEALKAATPPGDTELLALANKAQLEILSLTLRSITDEVRRAMMLEASGVIEDADGGMTVSPIFEYEQPHLIAVKAIANAMGWLENEGYIIIKDPGLDAEP
jgi:hypothetical protein